MATKQTTTEKTTASKPRRSAVERLEEQLAEARAAQQAKTLKRIANVQARRDSLIERRDKLIAQITEVSVELAAAKSELPLVTDGIGVDSEAIVTDGTDPEPVDADETEE